MSSKAIKQFVRFKAPFAKEVKEEIPGRDLAQFLAEQLQAKGLAVRPVENDEISFTVNVTSGSIEYPVMVCISTEDEEYWEINCPCTLGTFARLFGKSEDAELKNLTDTLDDILQNEKTITDIKWYGDYFDRTHDYIKKPGEKRLSTVGKYLHKSFLPLFLTGMVVCLAGVFLCGKDSILARLGAMLFLLPIVFYFGFIAVNILWGLITDIKESFQKKTKKKWVRWSITLLIAAAIVLPFFIGRLRNPTIDRLMSSRIISGLMALVLFVTFLAIAGAQLIISFSRVFLRRYRRKTERNELLVFIGSFLLLAGISGFLGTAMCFFGIFSWLPQSIELPLAGIDGIDVNREGYLFVLSGRYGRIQVYDPEGNFVRGWFFHAGKYMKIRINDENQIEVAAEYPNKIDVLDENGKLLRTTKFEDTDFFDSFTQKGKHLFDKSTRRGYDVRGRVLPQIVQTGPDGQRKIGKNAFYLFPFQGPFQGWATGMAGMILMIRADKKKKRRSPNASPRSQQCGI